MPIYHLELNAFPQVATLFNQTGQQVGAVVISWVQNQIVELDDEKWAPWEAKITIIEGPEIPLGGLSMGRGWKTALREGTDVTEKVLSEARDAIAESDSHGSSPSAPGDTVPAGNGGPVAAADLPRDYPTRAEEPARRSGEVVASSGASAGEADEGEVSGLLGEEPDRLLAAWRAVAARASGLTPSESLALAERELARNEGPQG
jgi:hypothetical protein